MRRFRGRQLDRGEHVPPRSAFGRKLISRCNRRIQRTRLGTSPIDLRHPVGRQMQRFRETPRGSWWVDLGGMRPLPLRPNLSLDKTLNFGYDLTEIK